MSGCVANISISLALSPSDVQPLLLAHQDIFAILNLLNKAFQHNHVRFSTVEALLVDVRSTYSEQYLHKDGMVGGPEFQNFEKSLTCIDCNPESTGVGDGQTQAMEAAATAGSGIVGVVNAAGSVNVVTGAGGGTNTAVASGSGLEDTGEGKVEEQAEDEEEAAPRQEPPTRRTSPRTSSVEQGTEGKDDPEEAEGTDDAEEEGEGKGDDEEGGARAAISQTNANARCPAVDRGDPDTYVGTTTLERIHIRLHTCACIHEDAPAYAHVHAPGHIRYLYKDLAVRRNRADEQWAKASIVEFSQKLIEHLGERYPKKDNCVLGALSNLFDFTAWPPEVISASVLCQQEQH